MTLRLEASTMTMEYGLDLYTYEDQSWENPVYIKIGLKRVENPPKTVELDCAVFDSDGLILLDGIPMRTPGLLQRIRYILTGRMRRHGI